MLSRLLVIIYAFFYIPNYIICKNLFIISKNKDLKSIHKMYNDIDNFLKNNKYKCMLFYPEGTRNLKETSLKLKKGLLIYSFERNIPIQIYITKNKENIYNERKIQSNFNIELNTAYSKLIEPKKYNNFEEYYTDINKNWDKLWNYIYKENKSLEHYYYKNINDNNYYKVNVNLMNKILYLFFLFFELFIYLYICYNFKLFILYPLFVILY